MLQDDNDWSSVCGRVDCAGSSSGFYKLYYSSRSLVGDGRLPAFLGRAGTQAPWQGRSPITVPALLLPREHAHSNDYGIAGVGGGALPALHNRQDLHLA